MPRQNTSWVYRVAVLGLVVVCSGMMACKSTGPQTPRASNPIEDEFAAAVDRDPTPRTLFAMARLLEARGRDAQAIYVLKRILVEDEAYVPAYEQLAVIYARQEEHGSAIAILKDGLKIVPDSPLLHNNLGICYMVDEQYDQAMASFDAAQKIAPREKRYQANRAAVLGLKGDYEASYQAYLAVVSEADAHYNVAIIMKSHGEMELAEKEFRLASAARQNK